MTLNLEMNMIDGAFAIKIAEAARKRRRGLAWKSVRGLRPWQMYMWVSWKPGRSEVSFPIKDRKGIPVQQHPGTARQDLSASSKPKGRHENRETGEGIASRQREEARRTIGSLSTLIVPSEKAGKPTRGSLGENVKSLLDSAKSGRYQAPAVRGVEIPKPGCQEKRPLGIPTIEDKVLQKGY